MQHQPLNLHMYLRYFLPTLPHLLPPMAHPPMAHPPMAHPPHLHSLLLNPYHSPCQGSQGGPDTEGQCSHHSQCPPQVQPQQGAVLQ
jgi:hypothetical protein